MNWSGDISATGSYKIADEDLYKNWLKAYVDMVEDCDPECQAKGSQMTLVGLLNSIALGFICINAFCMFAGTWRHRARIFSVYCTFFSCLFQFAVLVTSGVFLFTPFAMFCAGSLVQTAGKGIQWTMADDYATTVTLWATQFIWMFVFLFIGPTSRASSWISIQNRTSKSPLELFSIP